MKLKEVEIAWMAGLFDGEGCVYFRKTPSNTLAVRLRIGMTSFDAFVRFSDLLAQAEIKSNWYEQGLPSGKIVFTVEVAARQAVVKAVDLLAPFSITKRAELEAARVAVLMDEGGFEYLRELIPPRYKR